MSSHSIIKTGLGLGLMAASLGASAQLHSFGQPMMYTKSTGAATSYVAFFPSMAGPAAGVVYLEMLQSGTVSTWAYGLGGNPGAAGGGTAWSFINTRGSGAMVALSDASFQIHSMTPLSVASTVTLGSAAQAGSSTVSSSWYGGDVASLSMSFAQVQTISSQVCNVSFAVSMSTDDYLQFASFTVLPSGWASASAPVSYRTKSGTVVGDTAQIALVNWSNMSATMALPTFAPYSVPAVDGGAGQTIAASVVTKANVCATAIAGKLALNSAGSTIGAKAGLMRLW